MHYFYNCRFTNVSHDCWSRLFFLIVIGNLLIWSPDFPPLRTGHATFTASGTPSIFSGHLLSVCLTIDLWPFLHSHYRNFTGSITTFQQQFVCLLSFARLSLPGPAAFRCSDSSICTYISLGSCYRPVGLTVPVTQYGRS